MAALANAVRSRHGAPDGKNAPNPQETFSHGPRSSTRAIGGKSAGGWLRKQQWDWVPSIDQMPLWGNVASDEGVQAALRDAREAKQFPSNFLKPKNRLAGRVGGLTCFA